LSQYFVVSKCYSRQENEQIKHLSIWYFIVTVSDKTSNSLCANDIDCGFFLVQYNIAKTGRIKLKIKL